MSESKLKECRKLMAAWLILCLVWPILSVGSNAQTLGTLRTQNQAQLHKRKIAPDLEEELDNAERSENARKTIAQVRREKNGQNTVAQSWSLSQKSDVTASGETQRVIVTMDGLATRVALQACALKLGGQLKEVHNNLKLATIELPVARVRELAAETDVAYVSPDRPVEAFGHLEATTGAEQVRWLNGLLSPITGKGVGIAVIDSGVDNTHKLLQTTSLHPGVGTSTDFVSTNATVDRYGHGTYVASLIIANNAVDGGAYEGIAPNANVINLKVLDDYGTGFSSRLIAALDWCVTNKTKYNIRIINLSAGALAKDSYVNDPLCLAVRRAHAAGIVVVVAAGNDGKDQFGKKIYGGIHSPGIDPSVITVGAANTFYTDRRSDDNVATYSSRGPTRGYYTDAQGVKHYDNLLKPDLIAPGNKLIGASSRNPDVKDRLNNLVSSYPTLSLDAKAKIEERVMYLSGTSVAAPVVAGAAALLLEVNPNLTPNLVKAILMYSAQPIPNYNTLEQGAGLLNIDGAIRIARLIRSNPTTLPNGSTMIYGSLPAPQASTISKELCRWGQSVITNYCFLFGSKLMTIWQGVYASNYTLANATNVSSGKIEQTSGLTSTGVLNSSGVVFADGRPMGDGQLMVSGTMFADGVTYSSGVVFADGRLAFDPIYSGKIVRSKDLPRGD